MARFLVIPDLDLSTIYDMFDNSSNEMEYSKYVLEDKNILSFDLSVEADNSQFNIKYNDLIKSTDYEEITGESLYLNCLELYLLRSEDERIHRIILIDFRLNNKVTYITYTFNEVDGGVQEIPDNNQDIYKSRFDDMHEAVMQIAGKAISKKHIYMK